jgi:hypothetical protein
MTPANDNVYTLDEAAEHLRMTNRGVAKIARRYGLCMVNGRNLLLTGRDIEGIKDVMRCHSNSTSAAKSGGSAAPSMDKLSASLLALSKKKSPKRSAQNARLAS